MSRFLVAGAIAAAAALALTACGGGSAASDPVGTWGDPDTKTAPSLTLAGDGGLGGTDGCNTLGGSWKRSGDSVEFVDVVTTLMYCDNVDTWLSMLATGTIAGETMTVFDKDGAKIGTLDRNG